MALHWLARLALINQAYLRRHAQQIKQEDIARAHAQSEKVTAQLRTQRLLNSVAREAGELIALLRDYWRGRYTQVPRRVIGAAAFTVLYIANPFDLIPDYLVGIGFLDDVAVVNVAYLLMRKDLEAYRRWRGERQSGAPPTLARPSAEESERLHREATCASIIALPEPEAVDAWKQGPDKDNNGLRQAAPDTHTENASGTVSRNQPIYR